MGWPAAHFCAGKYNMVGLGISNSGAMLGADIVIIQQYESAISGSVWTVRADSALTCHAAMLSAALLGAAPQGWLPGEWSGGACWASLSLFKAFLRGC